VLGQRWTICVKKNESSTGASIVNLVDSRRPSLSRRERDKLSSQGSGLRHSNFRKTTEGCLDLSSRFDRTPTDLRRTDGDRQTDTDLLLVYGCVGDELLMNRAGDGLTERRRPRLCSTPRLLHVQLHGTTQTRHATPSRTSTHPAIPLPVA